MNNESLPQQGKSWVKRHPLWSIFIFAFVFLLVISLLASSASEKSKKLSPEDVAQLNQQLTTLKKDFVRNEDKFDKSVWYEHKNVSSGKHPLVMSVFESGINGMVASYIGDDWIFFNQIHVKIGDTVYDSGVITPSRSVISTSVSEVGVFTGAKADEILKAIAENTDKEISVRFDGKSNYDFTLSQKDKDAIKESYELAQIIAQLNNNN